MVNRLAFTLIELIFAIVIIAISVISLPMMNQTVAKGLEGNLAQEALFSAISEINIATSYAWDENSLLDTNLSTASGVDTLSRVIRTGTTGDCADSGLNDSAGNDINRRTGHINRRCLNNLATVPYNIAATDYVLSLNASKHDYNITVEGTASTTSSTGYKKEYESKLDVVRCDGTCVDFGDANNINMKEITVTIRDSSDDSVITLLRTYSANIGEVAYNNRMIP